MTGINDFMESLGDGPDDEEALVFGTLTAWKAVAKTLTWFVMENHWEISGNAEDRDDMVRWVQEIGNEIPNLYDHPQPHSFGASLKSTRKRWKNLYDLFHEIMNDDWCDHVCSNCQQDPHEDEQVRAWYLELHTATGTSEQPWKE